MDTPISFVQLESGEKFYAPDQDKIIEILEAFDSEHSHTAVFNNADGEQIMVDGSVLGGFIVRYESPSSDRILFSKGLSVSGVLSVIKEFMERNPDWQEAADWESVSKKSFRRLHVGVVLLIGAILVWATWMKFTLLKRFLKFLLDLVSG